MKKMRKFFALLIAMAIVLGMTAMTAFAATSHSITIKNENFENQLKYFVQF